MKINQQLGYWQQIFVDHLRAGYKKISGNLCIVEDDGKCSYCALGLMCEIAYQNGFCKASRIHMSYVYDQSGGYAPDSVVDLFQLHSHEGKFRNLKRIRGCGKLVLLNDNTMITFSELADLIEEDPAIFFKKPA